MAEEKKEVKVTEKVSFKEKAKTFKEKHPKIVKAAKVAAVFGLGVIATFAGEGIAERIASKRDDTVDIDPDDVYEFEGGEPEGTNDNSKTE